MDNKTHLKVTIVSIDAIKDDYRNWTWDWWGKLEEVFISKDKLTPRAIFKYLRDIGYLNDYSKGRLELDDDGYNLVVCRKSNHQPVIALCYGEHWEYNGL
jgi:hypothetical protein